MAKRKDHSQSDGDVSAKHICGKAAESSIAPAADKVPTGMDWLPCCEADEITSCWQVVLDHLNVQKSMPYTMLVRVSQSSSYLLYSPVMQCGSSWHLAVHRR
jgi:hypothetical protein